MDLNKNKLRQKIKKALSNLSHEDKKSASLNITNKLTSTEFWKNSDTILIYMSTQNEVQTEYIIEKAFEDKKKVGIPLIVNKEIIFYEINSLKDNFLINKYGIKEPDPNKHKLIEIKNCILIVPGIAFTKEGLRLGRGGGFYDRVINAHEDILRIGICYSVQLQDNIPVEKHDKKMNIVIYS